MFFLVKALISACTGIEEIETQKLKEEIEGGHLDGGGDTNIATLVFPQRFVDCLVDYVNQFRPRSLNIVWIGCGNMYEVKQILQIGNTLIDLNIC